MLQVSATDADSGRNSEIVYSLIDATGATPLLFAIDPSSGSITVTGRLDRDGESGKGSHTLTAVATDRAVPPDSPRRDTSTVTISVTDTNDIAPEWERGLDGKMVRYSTRMLL